jgi:hypothetical protein
MRIRTLTCWGFALLVFSTQVTLAQNLEDLVQRLVLETDTLSQRSYDSFSSRRNPSRSDIEALYQSRSLNASATRLRCCKMWLGIQDVMALTAATGAISSAPAKTWPGN